MTEIIFPDRFFVTGTDTDIGKTLVSAILAIGLDAGYFKPVQSGLETETDTEWVRRITGLPDRYFIPEIYRLTRPLSPHAAAEIDGIRIELSAFRLPAPSDYPRLIVEGAGGIMVPLNEKELMLDLIKQLALPVLLVARSALGTINHTLLSLAQMERAGIDVLGVVLNGPKNESNRSAIEHYSNVRVIAEIEPLQEITARTLLDAFGQFLK